MALAGFLAKVTGDCKPKTNGHVQIEEIEETHQEKIESGFYIMHKTDYLTKVGIQIEEIQKLVTGDN